MHSIKVFLYLNDKNNDYYNYNYIIITKHYYNINNNRHNNMFNSESRIIREDGSGMDKGLFCSQGDWWTFSYIWSNYFERSLQY